MLTVTTMLAAGVKAGGRTTLPAGGAMVAAGGATVRVAGGGAPVDTAVDAALPAGVTVTLAGVTVVASTAAAVAGTAVSDGGGASVGSTIAMVATGPSRVACVGDAVGSRVGGSGGTGVVVGGRVASTVATGAVAVGAEAAAEHPTRTGNKRSAARPARLDIMVFTRYNFIFTRSPEPIMINKPILRATAAFALISVVVSACAGPESPAPTATASRAATGAAPVVASPTAAPAVATAAPTKPVKPTDEPVEDFTPRNQSVWDTQVGPDSMKGCAGGSILPAYGLVQVTPEGATLIWKNQEPKPYTMTRIKPGVYAYEGPTALSDGTVKMVATFTSPTTVKMTRSFTPKAEAACVHTHEYSGAFKWETAPAATPKP